MDYHVPFGEGYQAKNTIFTFNDFNLKFLFLVELTAKELIEKKESNVRGIDGGASMLSSSCLFELYSKNNVLVYQSQLSILPYAKFYFKMNGKNFVLKNAGIQSKQWIIEQRESNCEPVMMPRPPG